MSKDKQMRRALVTGATGFIGAHLVQHLQQRGCTVAILGRPGSIKNYSGRRYEYTGETSHAIHALTDFKPDVLFHLASYFLATHAPEQVTTLITSNILFGAQLLEAMQATDCSVLINAGTAWQNYKQLEPSPVNLYAATKQAFEDLALYYVQAAGLRMITLRLFDSYGPSDPRPKLLRLLLDSIKTDQPLAMSPGDQILDLVHVDDICEAFIHAGNLALESQSTTPKVYALSGRQRRTLKEVVATLEEASGRKLNIDFGARPYRTREVMTPWVGPALPGWEPKISLLEGLRQLVTLDLNQ
jgi:nucleoside-diphosphate-sugar epimerase